MKPFLKWPGGKYKLVKTIKNFLPNGNRLVEPFVGAGSVFLNTDFNEYWINDINIDLILVYFMLKNKQEDFIKSCKSLFNKNDVDIYYKRREEFNNNSILDERKAALFLWLNRHCFNGLCRYNSKGKFNVPFGKYKTIYFPEKEMNRACEVLQKTKITCLNFDKVIKTINKNDVLYCDPPYIPINQTSNFTSYFSSKFGIEDQKKLSKLCEKKNAVISNSYCDLSLEIFSKGEQNIIEVRRSISCKDRSKVNELIIVFKKEQV